MLYDEAMLYKYFVCGQLVYIHWALPTPFKKVEFMKVKKTVSLVPFIKMKKLS